MSCGDANRNTDPEQPASSHEAVPSSSLAPWLHGSALGKVFTGMRTDFWTIALDNDLNRRPAVTDGTSGRTLSYAEFGICAGRLALGVRLALGPCHEPPVLALCRNRGAGMVVCMWACQLAGGVYSPMNHTLPVDRCAPPGHLPWALATVWYGVAVSSLHACEQQCCPAPPPPPLYRVQRMPYPRNTCVRTLFGGGLIHEVPNLGTESIEYRTACPTLTPVRAVFFEDFILRWTGGGELTTIGGGGFPPPPRLKIHRRGSS